MTVTRVSKAVKKSSDMLPVDLQAEQAVLGSLMINSKSSSEIIPCTEEDFFDESNRIIFRFLKIMEAAGLPRSDLRILVDMLRSNGKYEAVGGAKYLATVMNSVVNAGHLIHYAQIVSEMGARRRLIAVATETIERMTSNENPFKHAEWIEAKLQECSGGAESSVKTISQVMMNVVDGFRQSNERKKLPSVSTGFTSCDEIGLRFFPSELSIIAARPSVGKSVFGSQVCAWNGIRGKRSMFVSLEMSDDQVGTRIICPSAGVNSQKVRISGASEEEILRMESVAKEFSDVPYLLWSPGPVSINKIVARVRLEHAIDPLSIVIIDYLQLILPPNPYKKRHEQIGDICKQLKQLAHKLEIPVAALCQLNRDTDKQKVPTLSNLGESSSIEQDGDLIVFLYREKEDQYTDEIGFIVAKNRQGARGHRTLTLVKDESRFEDRSEPVLFPD